MAGSYNKIIIIGNLGRDPEMRYLPSGDPVTTFSVATTERSRDGAEKTTWFRVSAFSKLAEICSNYLKKGSSVYIEGALTQSEYTDREGTQRQSLEVRAREMQMLDRRGESGADMAMAASTPAASPTSPSSSFGSGNDETGMDDIPF